jgi:hypothetical protein
MKRFILPALAGCLLTYVTPAQSVGINNNGPLAHLEITSNTSKPNLWLSQTNPADYSRIRFDNFTTNFWDISSQVAGTPANSRLNFYFNTTGNMLTLTGNGMVGIGNNNPLEALHIGAGNLAFINSNKGVILNAADAPLITRGFDPFSSGNKIGIGRWGLFMEPNLMVLGIPNAVGKRAGFVKYNADGSFSELASFGTDGSFRVPGLAGPGSTVLVVDPSGNVQRRAAASYNITLDGRDFKTLKPSGGNTLYGDDPVIMNGGLESSTSYRGEFEKALYASLFIPDGAVIANITLTYSDNLIDNDLHMDIPACGIAWQSNGTAGILRTVTISPNTVVNNLSNKFFVVLHPNNGTWWDGDVQKMSFNKLVIEYRL